MGLKHRWSRRRFENCDFKAHDWSKTCKRWWVPWISQKWYYRL